jgi:hypothetical protein
MIIMNWSIINSHTLITAVELEELEKLEELEEFWKGNIYYEKRNLILFIHIDYNTIEIAKVKQKFQKINRILFPHIHITSWESGESGWRMKNEEW